jgi:hypothetical protein
VLFTVSESEWRANQNEQYPGFARAHAPYYWLDSTQLNFRDRTRPGAVYVIWPFMTYHTNHTDTYHWSLRSSQDHHIIHTLYTACMAFSSQGGIQLERGRISLPGHLNIFSHASHLIFKKTNSQKTVSYFLFFCFFLRSQFLRSQTLILTVKDLTYGMV